jgi:predicted alpha-1,6-mannanase (GH76 family)
MATRTTKKPAARKSAVSVTKNPKASAKKVPQHSLAGKSKKRTTWHWLTQKGSVQLRKMAVIAAIFGVGGVYLMSVSFAATPVATVNNANTRAAIAMAQLHSWYNPATYNTAGWWQSANALGATIDYMQETGSRAYLSDVQSFYAAHSSNNFIINKYYDDEGWWALTWIKAYKLTGNVAYLNTAKAIFTNMTGGWDTTCGGGLWWTSGKTYKNAIPNELFLDIAAQLHNSTPNDTTYANWANKEWTWFSSSGLINASNQINDGLTSACLNNNQTTWTYNQGVILDGLVNLYSITKNATLLTTANNIANATINSSTLSPSSILTEPCEPKATCGSDNAMFKGIFMQNLNVLYKQTSNSAYQAYMAKNANSLWTNDRSNGNEFGLHWAGPFDSADAVRQASALDLLNTQILAPTTNITATTPVQIYSGMNGFCIDDYQASSALNNKVDLYTCNGTGAQKWTLTAAGKIEINNKCVDLYQANKANGGKVDLYTCNSGTTQTWQIRTDGTIYNPASGKCLDDPGGSKINTTQLDIWTCNGTSNQIWYMPS